MAWAKKPQICVRLKRVVLTQKINMGIQASRVEAAIKGAEAMGAKVTGFYVVMGEYDYVAIGEFPNDQAAMTFALALGSGGNVRTTNLKAFTKEEFTEMVKKLPKA
jgi:uncharacterized protein with GYD domain